jgi:hypothetical protein
MIVGMPVEAEEILQGMGEFARIFYDQDLHNGTVSCQDGVRLVRNDDTVKIRQNPYQGLVFYCSWEELT